MRRPDRRGVAVLALALGAVLLPTGCSREPPPAAPRLHYVLGPPWQGDNGSWFYPDERFEGSFTGLATTLVLPTGSPMTDGLPFDSGVAAASVQRLQLPVVLRVTDLDTGRSIELRADQRGPSSPRRIVGLDRRALTALGVAPGDVSPPPIPVSIEIDGAASRRLADALHAGPHLDITAAPLGAVTEQALPPPGDAVARIAAAPRDVGPGAGPVAPVAADAAARIAEDPRTAPVSPHALYLDAGTFSGRAAAETVAAAIGGEATSDGEGRHPSWSVRRGPFDAAAAADAALDQARAAGISGVRIVVD